MNTHKPIGDQTSDLKIRVSIETRRQLEAVARRDGISFSHAARQAIAAGLQSPIFQKESGNGAQ